MILFCKNAFSYSFRISKTYRKITQTIALTNTRKNILLVNCIVILIEV